MHDPNYPYEHPSHEHKFPREFISNLREQLRSESMFIFTLGLAMCWFDPDGTVPVLAIDPRDLTKREWRRVSVEENAQALKFIVETLREINPDINVVLTLSPVPLNRSPGFASAVATDCISKATLRVAVHEYLSEAPDGVYYWPSFEIVRWLGAHLPPVFGEDDGMSRHVNSSMVNMIVKLFLKHFVAP